MRTECRRPRLPPTRPSARPRRPSSSTPSTSSRPTTARSTTTSGAIRPSSPKPSCRRATRAPSACRPAICFASSASRARRSAISICGTRTTFRERFFSGKTRALHATHVTTGDRLWSTLPYLRPLATITHDTLDWYGFDADGGGIHDVIGTRCDPYTQLLLGGTEYHHCCHSNLTRALGGAHRTAARRGRAPRARRAQRLHVHRLHARHAPVFHEGEPGAAGRLHRVLRRDRSVGRAIGLPRRRLQRHAFERRGAVLAAQGGGVEAEGGGVGGVEGDGAERVWEGAWGGIAGGYSRRSRRDAPRTAGRSLRA